MAVHMRRPASPFAQEKDLVSLSCTSDQCGTPFQLACVASILDRPGEANQEYLHACMGLMQDSWSIGFVDGLRDIHFCDDLVKLTSDCSTSMMLCLDA